MTEELVIVLQNNKYTVKDIGRKYPADSVLAGQPMICFIDSFDTLDAAKAQYPHAELSHDLLMPQNSFNHLSDTGDY